MVEAVEQAVLGSMYKKYNPIRRRSYEAKDTKLKSGVVPHEHTLAITPCGHAEAYADQFF